MEGDGPPSVGCAEGKKSLVVGDIYNDNVGYLTALAGRNDASIGKVPSL